MATQGEVKDIENRINKFCYNLAKEVVQDLAPLETAKPKKSNPTTKKTNSKK